MQRQMIRFRSGIQSKGKVEAQLQQWTQQLHDPSGRNRLLYYRDTKASSATIEDPGFLDLFHILVERGSELRVPIPSLADVARQANADRSGDRAEDLEDLLPGLEDDQEGGAYDRPRRQAIEPDPNVDPDAEAASQGARQHPRPRSRGRTSEKSKYHHILTNHSVAHLNDVMYNLRYAARTVQEEQGFNILYVTFGMLRWRDVRSPGFSQAPWC